MEQGKTLATRRPHRFGFGDDPGVAFYDATTGKKIRENEIEPRCLLVSPDGTISVRYDDKLDRDRKWISSSIVLQELATGKTLLTLPSPSGNRNERPVFAPDGKTLAVSGNGGVYLWHLGDLLLPAKK